MIAKIRGRVFLMAAMVLVVPCLGWGSGFALFEVGARAGGMAGAMTAVADDQSALFWNPAGMAFQTNDGIKLMVGTTLIQPEQSISGMSPYPGDGYTAAQIEQTFYPVHLYLSIPVNERLEVSFALHNPFGLGTEWDDDFLGRYISKKADLMTFDIGVSMAYQLSDRVAFGIGVDYMYTTVELTRNIGLINPFNQRLTDVAETNLKTDGINSAWAWNVGLLWKLGSGFSFGASYRSDFTINGDGIGTFTQVPTGNPEFDGIVGSFLPFDEDLPITASIAFPDFWNVGLSWQNEKWTLSGQYGVQGWSAFSELPIIFPENPEFSQVLPENYEDAAQWRIGGEFRANQHWALQLGYLQDETGQPISSMSPLLGDGDRTSYTGGISYRTDRFRFDIAYEHVKTAARSTEGTSFDGFDGTYEGSSPLLFLSLTFKF